MTCPDWCAQAHNDGHQHETLWSLHGGDLTVLAARADGPPLLELEATPAHADTVAGFIHDALTHLTTGATIVITITERGDQLG